MIIILFLFDMPHHVQRTLAILLGRIAHAAHSWIVNVNCLPRVFSNRFGGLISRMQLMPMASTSPKMNETNMPDQMGAVVKPTQLIAASKRLPLTLGCACGIEESEMKSKINSFIGSVACHFPSWSESFKLISVEAYFFSRWMRGQQRYDLMRHSSMYAVSRLPRRHNQYAVPKPWLHNIFDVAVVSLLCAWQTSSSSW